MALLCDLQQTIYEAALNSFSQQICNAALYTARGGSLYTDYDNSNMQIHRY